MPNITVYSGPNCPYCVRAKALLEKKGAQFEDVDIKSNPDRREEMLAKSNGRQTIPQIFIGGKHIGGCDDLYALEDSGELDKLLSA